MQIDNSKTAKYWRELYWGSEWCSGPRFNDSHAWADLPDAERESDKRMACDTIHDYLAGVGVGYLRRDYIQNSAD